MRVLVDGNGDAAVLQTGDRIGPDSPLAHVADLAPDWLIGVNGYLGVEFVCEGRMVNPPVDRVCYGYIHMTTGDDGGGFPATIVEYAFDTVGFDIVVGDDLPIPACYTSDTIYCDTFDLIFGP